MTASGPSSSSSGTTGMKRPASSSLLSPNHPTNLRRQAKATLDASYSVRSYLGAAAALLEKAEASDRQGHLEQAFVNYLKAANVASFISKHPEWPKVQSERGTTYFRYQDFMQKITDVISRATRIEEALKQREEANVAQQHSAARERADSAAAVSSSAATMPSDLITSQADGPSAPPPPPAEPGPSKQLRANPQQEGAGEAASVLMNTRMRAAGDDDSGSRRGSGSQTPVLAGSAERRDSVSSEKDQVSNLADRLSALRTGGIGSTAMRNRMSEPINPLRTGSVPEGEDEQANLPSAHQIKKAYPSLDEFDRSVPSPEGLPSVPAADPNRHDSMGSNGTAEGENDLFPSTPSHAPGGSRRPLPNPPPMPHDLALGRDVPKPFDLAESGRSAGGAPSPTKTRASLPRPASLIPGSPRNAGPSMRVRPPIPSPSHADAVGPKPSLPRGNHIKVEELWSLLNPGFERIPVNGSAGSSGETRMVRKRGLDILLLDLRSREEFDAGRVATGTATEAVCLEGGVILRRGMTSSDLEDKLLLAPPVEQNAFSNRHKYDAVVIYDRSSRLLGHPNPSTYNPAISGWPTYEEAARAWDHLDTVVKAIYEQEFNKTLRSSPLLLVGGWESWNRKVGAGDKVAQTQSNANSPTSTRTQSGRSDSVSGSPESTRRYAQNQEDEILKRQRRQGFVMPSSSPPLPSYPSGNGFAPGSHAGLPVPAKAYQAPTTPGGSAAPSTYTSSRSSGMNNYFPSQPSIPYGVPAGAPALPPAMRQSSGTFDYPQLKSTSSPKPPPVAVNSNGISTRSMTTHAHNETITSPAGRGVSGDVSRRPPVASLSTAAGSRMNIRMLPAFDDLRIGLTGLKNVGNSCYQNSTLQCLSATIPLAKFMLDGSYKKAINVVNPLGTQGALAEAFAHLIKVMWSEQYTFVSPVTFREAISRFAPTFRGFDQHDSQEFLAFLLDGLHEDLNYVINKPPPVEMTPEREDELETLPQQVASVKEWTIYRQRNDSLIVDWFQGQFRNKMTCLTCGKTSTTYNAFMYLSLPIPVTGRGINRVALQQCLDAFVKEEVMDKADAWYCPSCKKPRKATKRLSISRLPMILLIHLKRFSFKGPFTDKIETQVTFPLQGLDLTNYMPPPLSPALAKSYAAQGVPTSRSQTPPFVYDLYGVTHHFGSLNTGHYTASIKSAGKWWYCDDSRTVAPPPGPAPTTSTTNGLGNGTGPTSTGPMSEGEKRIHSSSPYILWWRRRG